MEAEAAEDSLGLGQAYRDPPQFLPCCFPQFEFECRARGADILAYPPVVAGGNRSNTLHYVKNNQLIKVHKIPQCFSLEVQMA